MSFKDFVYKGVDNSCLENLQRLHLCNAIENTKCILLIEACGSQAAIYLFESQGRTYPMHHRALLGADAHVRLLEWLEVYFQGWYASRVVWLFRLCGTLCRPGLWYYVCPGLSFGPGLDMQMILDTWRDWPDLSCRVCVNMTRSTYYLAGKHHFIVVLQIDTSYFWII